MDDDGSLGIRNWGFYETVKGSLGLQLMSSVASDRDTKPLLPNGSTFLQHHGHHNAPQQQHPQHLHHPHDCGGASGGMPTEPPSVHMDFVRNEAWLHPLQHQHPRQQKVLHHVPVGPVGHVGHAMHHHPTGYGMMTDPHGLHTLQMMQPQPQPQPQDPPPSKEESMPPPPTEDHSVVKNEPPVKKRQQHRQPKSPKPKKPKKVAAPREDGAPNRPVPRGRGPRNTVGIVINGIDLDLSRIPTPVCSCTGTPQQCYRWGAGGWQSACCTTSISTYPLPMSTKRRGARIAGRKMSQGAFKKVLEKLAGEGYNLNNPIDLKTFWAKHGTNKFVTIR
ncbi:protein Barley B recombinant-like [Phragmites australis]|uniref:protein Barley B recombinant-like n=1 Tax=Phragmites australis TaxID=29695 RepID=UPI002D78C05E|nr:protein Barley B recombinant-like [Phragmites australis]XP_062210497.1 protein Barley B recombinant-like [Phragmites australis]XP_062210498.1 protein Barley B recombinant-like [Phragmites australis]XP_062210499.1 protein Barley B recombinant-like [Phragmites australis]